MQFRNQSNMLTLEELDLVTSSDQRLHPRFEQQLSVQVVCPRVDRAPVGSDIYLGWIDDVSEAGAKLRIPRSVTADRFYIRFPEAPSRNDFIECCIMWTDIPADEPNALMPSEAMFRCGVEFQQVLSREEFEQRLIDARGGEELSVLRER
mgnify:FL=1